MPRQNLGNVIKQMYKFSQLIKEDELDKAVWRVTQLEDMCSQTVKHIKQQFAEDCADIANDCLEGWIIEK